MSTPYNAGPHPAFVHPDDPGRPSSSDLDNYFDNAPIPPPHRISGSYPPTPSPPRAGTPEADPFHDPYSNTAAQTSYPGSSGPFNRNYAYLSPPAAAQATASHSEPMAGYSDLEHESPWLEKQERSSRWSQWLIRGALVGAIVLIAVGVTVGVVVSKKHTSNSLISNNNKTAGVVNSSSTDPSQFTKDPRLHNSFYGFAYTPYGAILPQCGASQANITEDIQLLSQLTKRIRTYGSDCNVSSFILQAIQDTKVDMTVYLGLFVSNDDTVYARQRNLNIDAIKTYGPDHVGGITVGNEFILDNLTDANLSDPNSPTGISAAEFLKTKIADTRNALAGLNLAKPIPVGTADAGSSFNTDILEAVDYAMGNIHPWFGSVPIDQAAGWTWDFFETNDVALAATTPNNPPFFIAETGWPTQSSDAKDASDGPSLASVPNLQIFLDTFVCQANTNNTNYFFFEFMDETWKDIEFGGVEGWWGLFDPNKQLKNVTIPDCPHS